MSYVVFRSDGEERAEGLSLAEAARAILYHDGCDFELRPRPEGDGFDLWSRQQVANIRWHKTHWFSLEDNEDAAWLDIAERVVEDSQKANWRGLIAEQE